MFQQFSPNMLKTYELCPKKFYLKYIKGINMPVNDDMFEFGKNIHALASYYLRGENIVNMESSLSDKQIVAWEYLKGIEYFSYQVVATEYNLTVKVGNHFFGGRLDALVKNDDRYYILDYKTGSVPQNPKSDFQTIIYILAVKEFFQTDKVVFVYIDIKNKNEIKIEYSKELENEYKKKLATVLKNVELQDYEPDKKKGCVCEYSLVCF